MAEGFEQAPQLLLGGQDECEQLVAKTLVEVANRAGPASGSSVRRRLLVARMASVRSQCQMMFHNHLIIVIYAYLKDKNTPLLDV